MSSPMPYSPKPIIIMRLRSNTVPSSDWLAVLALVGLDVYLNEELRLKEGVSSVLLTSTNRWVPMASSPDLAFSKASAKKSEGSPA